MNRERFARFCLEVSVLGLLVMYGSTLYFSPEKVSPGDISREDMGETVSVVGNVSGFYSAGSASFFTLESSSGSVSVVDFEGRSLPDGRTVEVTGRVDLHEGDVQLVASSIE